MIETGILHRRMTEEVFVFYFNDSWCKNVKVLSKVCTKNLECLSLKCRPIYLPREFSSITITGVYIHPAADKAEALHDLTNIVSKFENDDPDTLSIVLGDFNRSNLKDNLPNFRQVITCPTREQSILDHCYLKVLDWLLL